MATSILTIEERFQAFHAENPQVFDSLMDHAYKLRAAGQTRLSITMLYEIARYESALQTTGNPFKMNNTYRSRYVRMMQQADPELGAMFETRELRAA